MTKVVTCRFVLTDNYIPANSTSLYLSLNELRIQLKLQYPLSKAYLTELPGKAFFHLVRLDITQMVMSAAWTDTQRSACHWVRALKCILTEPPGQAFSHSVRHKWHPDSYACHADRYIEVDQWASGLECLTSNQEVLSLIP